MPKRKVLVVEDEEVMLGSLRDILKYHGCEVFIATKSEEAWEIFQKERPDAVSIDIHMAYSQFDGIDLLRKIRNIDKKTRCIMLSCVDKEENQDVLKLLAIDGYYEKPMDKPDIADFVNKMVGKDK